MSKKLILICIFLVSISFVYGFQVNSSNYTVDIFLGTGGKENSSNYTTEIYLGEVMGQQNNSNYTVILGFFTNYSSLPISVPVANVTNITTGTGTSSGTSSPALSTSNLSCTANNVETINNTIIQVINENDNPNVINLQFRKQIEFTVETKSLFMQSLPIKRSLIEIYHEQTPIYADIVYLANGQEFPLYYELSADSCGFYSFKYTPQSTGNYFFNVKIDGFQNNITANFTLVVIDNDNPERFDLGLQIKNLKDTLGKNNLYLVTLTLIIIILLIIILLIFFKRRRKNEKKTTTTKLVTPSRE